MSAFGKYRRSPLAFSYLTVVLLCLSASTVVRAGKPLLVGDHAPDWILQSGQGDYISFYRDSADKHAVLLFWATWCPYCTELMPELQALREQFKDVKFYAINIWEDGHPEAFVNRRGFDFTLLLKGDMVAKRYGVSSAPGLVVVGPDKTVRYVRQENTPVDVACDEIEQLLKTNAERTD